jgi:hypothetical protein|tara:strand:+ start:623 stop:952 length:330 start_codon:yes stop_codon:yes gene_type:complete
MSIMQVDAISDTAGTGSPSFPNGITVDGTLGATIVDAPTVTSTNVNSTNVTATTVTSATVGVTTVDLGDWTIIQVGSDLIFRHGTTNRFKLSSAGALTVEGDVTAFGSA